MEFVLLTSKNVSLLLLLLLVMTCFAEFRSNAQVLPDDEVEALKAIVTKLKYKDWNATNVNSSSCNGLPALFPLNENSHKDDDSILSNVTCNCTFNNSTTCHVTNIQLKGLNLSGTIPNEFGNLSYLQEIDLTRNYLTGSIPESLAQLHDLVTLSLLGNRINGSIPGKIGGIATLEELVLEDNQLSGPLHENLGNLSNLRRLILSGNNFSGRIPESFINLTNLTDFRIDGSSLSGQIPALIGAWVNITRLDMEGTGMDGPIPDISKLTKLEELRISDLRGPNIRFPYLKNLKKLERLVLRNCAINDSIQDYIGDMGSLKVLDLSFNRLTGQIPVNWTADDMESLDYLFLTNNSLGGEIPSWILDSNQRFDVSYNNFSGPPQGICSASEVNLVSSFSYSENKTPLWCLKKDLPCPHKPRYHTLRINCGGKAINVEGKKYEEDSDRFGPSFFSATDKKNWAYSSTGVFTGKPQTEYIVANTSNLSVMAPEYYQTARIAPLSLKYYALCLRKGNYTVRLHFAEIMYTDGQNYSSNGRRIFDIFIQGKLERKDFNIIDKANVAGNGTFEEFPNITVSGSTLEIHLYWSGKGTSAIPQIAVYGPLISAIEVTPNFDVSTGLSAGAIAGIVVASCVPLVLILVVLRQNGFLGGKDLEDKGSRNKLSKRLIGIGSAIVGIVLIIGISICCFRRKVSLNSMVFRRGEKKNEQNIEAIIRHHGSLAPKRYSYSDIKKITYSFKDKLGQGGFGNVYKGKLLNGHPVAVKVCKETKGNGEDFINEVASISRTSHVNVVTLLGFCLEGHKRALIYEFMPNGSLDKFIYNENSLKTGQHMGWEKLHQIAIGIAQGLEYLHRGCNTRILHFDIKPHNILLDKDFCPKISDFGLSKLCPTKESIISMLEARGTIGYIAPEVFSRNFGGVSHKSDVYSYGMMVLEMVGGRKNIDVGGHTSEIYFPHWVYKHLELDNNLRLQGDMSEEENIIAKKMIIVGLWCIQTNPSNRPSMSEVTYMLEGSIEALQIPPKPYLSSPPRSQANSSTLSIPSVS